MARVYGLGPGALTFIADFAKTCVSMLLGRLIAGDNGCIIAGAACIVGHCWPVFFGFKGGKGVSVGASIALSVIRIIFDFSLTYYIVPGYFISLVLSLFVPPVYTAIAFDSGGVASGPMTSGFILPFATGACVCLQGADAVLRDAFGVVALVAMTPLITIQLLGFRGIVAEKLSERRAMKRILDADDQQIINFM